jgi:hypothetical protein
MDNYEKKLGEYSSGVTQRVVKEIQDKSKK